MTHFDYVPLSFRAAGLFSALVAGFVILAAIGLMNRVSATLGLDPLTVTLILLASLIGSTFDIPLARLPGEQVSSREALAIMGVPFLAPVAVDWPERRLRSTSAER